MKDGKVKAEHEGPSATRPGAEVSARYLSTPMAFVARTCLRTSQALAQHRFFWRLAPHLADIRDGISSYYGYRIPSIVIAKLHGRTLRFSGTAWNGVASGVFWGGATGMEPVETALLIALAPRYHVVLDIGANVGWYSIVLSAFNRAVRVYAFEPSPSVGALLAENVALNGADVVVMPKAVARKAGSAVFFVAADDWASSLVIRQPASSELAIDTVTVDDVRSSLGLTPDFVKIDVEGSELDVLEGARVTLRECRPDILIEITPSRTEPERVLSLLREAGYSRFWTESGGGIVYDPELSKCEGRTIINDFTTQRPDLPEVLVRAMDAERQRACSS